VAGAGIALYPGEVSGPRRDDDGTDVLPGLQTIESFYQAQAAVKRVHRSSQFLCFPDYRTSSGHSKKANVSHTLCST